MKCKWAIPLANKICSYRQTNGLVGAAPKSFMRRESTHYYNTCIKYNHNKACLG
jgi:hypothetical protein